MCELCAIMCALCAIMCELCAIWHFSACLAAIATCSMSAHACTHACNLSASRLLAACGAKVRHENHSYKLLRENFTMKRIFSPKAAWFPPQDRAEGCAYCKAKHTQIGPIHSTGLFCLACTQDCRQGVTLTTEGWPPMHCFHTRPFHMQYAPHARYLTNINI